MGMADVITGLCRGATRRIITSKEGNRFFYKGRGSGAMGRVTTKGRYVLEPHRFRKWAVPDLTEFKLFPFVVPEADKNIRRNHDLRDYFKPENTVGTDIEPEILQKCAEEAEAATERRRTAKKWKYGRAVMAMR
ncbi:hypothetical protein HK097_003333 [Rhizophlyctis rosea]|uniref:39S ribosomal protein L41, mitochondrial n=1 Tax=Rhizophlyctis rosea TaxID=64517 RepID=A0AAD5S4I2_9FUNG|nr:hypothetical protein HK097_003333 [Rhizophlyctis rosea]